MGVLASFFVFLFMLQSWLLYYVRKIDRQVRTWKYLTFPVPICTTVP